MKRWKSLAAFFIVLAAMAGCATFHEKQGEWIFQPTGRTWGGPDGARGMEDVWIEFDSRLTGRPVRLHALWLAADPTATTSPSAQPVMLYLHGARWNVESSAFRARHMQEHGFSVIVEGAFTSLPDVLSTMKWGWLPVSWVMTQRFDAAKQVASIGSPLLVVHGAEDKLISPELGQRLYAVAREPKVFVPVKGGPHHNTNAVGQDQYRQAIAQLFGLEQSGIPAAASMPVP